MLKTTQVSRNPLLYDVGMKHPYEDVEQYSKTPQRVYNISIRHALWCVVCYYCTCFNVSVTPTFFTGWVSAPCLAPHYQAICFLLTCFFRSSVGRPCAQQYTLPYRHREDVPLRLSAVSSNAPCPPPHPRPVRFLTVCQNGSCRCACSTQE